MIRLAVVYFALVFVAGFVLGTMRVLLLVPRLGLRAAELLEIPLMLAVVYLVGRWIASQTTSRQQALGSGFIALALLLTAEVLLGAMLFGKSPIESLLDKDLIAGIAYYLSLIAFAMMPWYVRGKLAGSQQSHENRGQVSLNR